jgi:hypothetical protein
MNLLAETIEVLGNHNKTTDDVLWVGTKEIKTTWFEFSIVANVEYDDGFGGAEVAGDLLIVGNDWWMERHEYDGSEWWEFKSQPKEPLESFKLFALTEGQAGTNSWSGDLAGFNGLRKEE